jgi:hypothetical protein
MAQPCARLLIAKNNGKINITAYFSILKVKATAIDIANNNYFNPMAVQLRYTLAEGSLLPISVHIAGGCISSTWYLPLISLH